MLRSATLALSIITNRIWTPVLYLTFDPLRDSVFGGDEEKYLWVVAGAGAWLGWTIPLLGLQLWLSWQAARARARPPSLSGV